MGASFNFVCSFVCSFGRRVQFVCSSCAVFVILLTQNGNNLTIIIKIIAQKDAIYSKKAPKLGTFCVLVRLMGFEPIYYHAISCFLLPRVQFRVQFFVKSDMDIPYLTPSPHIPGGLSCAGSS